MARLRFNSSCITPLTVRLKHKMESIPVPCGKCPKCLARRVSHWSFRLMQEYKISISAFFITLTYDTKYVPITRNGFMSLDKEDVQRFMKRLRKLEYPSPLKYYVAGEYGGKTNRPHYHMILFNVVNQDNIEKAWSVSEIKSKKGRIKQKANGGMIHYGQVEEASVGYTLKYISKRKKIPMHKNDDREMEFALMSKGIGENYVTEQMKRYHHADLLNRMCVNLKDGKVASMPRYYKNRIYTEGERLKISNHQRYEMEKFQTEQEQKYKGDYTRDLIELHKYQFELQNKNAEKRDKL